MITNILDKIKSEIELNNNELENLFNELSSGRIKDEELKDIIVYWGKKGFTVNEIALLSNLININQNQSLKYPDSVDICGTGGDKSNTLNISTLSAIILSSMGVNVIKHSGRSNTSISGSTDLISSFGIDVDADLNIKESCFENYKLLFTSSSLLRNIFGRVKILSKELNTPGIVNLLGPLTNPYITDFHLLGVSRIEWGEFLAQVLMSNKSKKRILIVCSEVTETFFLDELSFSGKNHIWEIIPQDKITKTTLTQKEFEECKIELSEIIIKTKEESLRVFENVLKGDICSSKNLSQIKTVALNVGAGLYLRNKASSIVDGYNSALNHIKKGYCWEHFKNFVTCITDRYNANG